MNAFRKAKRRFKERVSEQVLGSEKFVDPIFDAGLDSFNTWNYHLQKVEAAHRHYLDTMDAQTAAAANLADELVALHFSAVQLQQDDDTGFGSLSFDKELKQPIEKFARVQTLLGKSSQTQWYQEAVVDHLRQQQACIPTILARVRKRENAILDYSAYKRKAQHSSKDTDILKKIEREKKHKDARQVLDDQTKSLLDTFTDLETRRPNDIYEDMCSILALQLDLHRRSVEILECELPNFKGMAYPLCQLSVASNDSSSARFRRRPTHEKYNTTAFSPTNHPPPPSPPHSHQQQQQKLNPTMTFKQMEMVAAPALSSATLGTSHHGKSGGSNTHQAATNTVDAVPPLPTRRKKASVDVVLPPRPPKNKSHFQQQQKVENQTRTRKATATATTTTTIPATPTKTDIATCTAQFVAASASELSMTVKERVTVLRQEGNGWWFVRNNVGKTGWVPSTFLSR